MKWFTVSRLELARDVTITFAVFLLMYFHKIDTQMGGAVLVSLFMARKRSGSPPQGGPPTAPAPREPAPTQPETPATIPPAVKRGAMALVLAPAAAIGLWTLAHVHLSGDAGGLIHFLSPMLGALAWVGGVGQPQQQHGA